MQRDVQDFVKVGNDILNSVTSAIDRNDYSNLSDEVSRAIKSVHIDRNVTYSSQRTGQDNYQNRQRSSYNTQNRYNSTPLRGRVYPFFQKSISKYSGVVRMCVGGFLGINFLLAFLGMLIDGVTAGTVVTGLITAACAFLVIQGYRKFGLAKKYHQYGNILKEAEYFKISDLGRACAKSDKEVLKDIKEMIKQGFLPRARLDNTETTCMLTDRVVEQYMGAEKDRIEREAREAKVAALNSNEQPSKKKGKNKDPEYEKLPENAKAILDEGYEYIEYVRHVNDIIPDTEEFSNKLYRLEEIMNRIFAQIKKDPSSADELQKLMDYYLPTTKKLLNAYVELYSQPDLDNIRQTKGEIETAIDTINEAFKNLLDSMFQDMAWDISSDISVMKTMMAQDGLTTQGQGVAAQMQTQGQVQAQTETQTLTFGK
ncbi:MAG: 5-bromo-4-chloroindolyl phosphate hydrolysis family protein [Butyrivibrio sp.]|nr:5-bromo-4-chloroindolyl phosphate hydrolysis family protein [Butyrivibrio sp.]